MRNKNFYLKHKLVDEDSNDFSAKLGARKLPSGLIAAGLVTKRSEAVFDPFLDQTVQDGDVQPDRTLHLDLKRKNSNTSSNDATVQREGSASPRSPKVLSQDETAYFSKLK